MNTTSPGNNLRNLSAPWLLLCAPLLAVCLALLAASAQAQANHPEKRQPIAVVYGANGFAPYYTRSITNPSGLYYNGIGMFPDFLNAFATRYPEYKIETIQLPRKRISEWVRNKSAQVVSLSNPDIEPAQGYSFSLPLWNSSDYIVSRRADDFVYDAPENLYGLRVGVILGNRYGKLDKILAAPQVRLTRVITHCQLHDLLSRDRVDVIIANRLTLLRSLRRRSLSDEGLRFSRSPVFSMRLSVMVRSDLRHFLNLLNSYIDECRKNGTLDRIAKDWETNMDFPACPSRSTDKDSQQTE